MSKKVTTFEHDMELQKLSKTRAKELHALANKKERDSSGLFMVEGEKSLMDSIGFFRLRQLVCLPDWIERHGDLLRAHGDKILVGSPVTMSMVTTLSSAPSVIGIFEKPHYPEVIDYLSPDGLYLLLDDVQDPGNLGTIIRTCDWFGVYDIFASPGTADVYSPKVVKSAMGSLSRVRVRYTDLSLLIENNRDVKVIGTLLKGFPLEEYSEGLKGFLLMGNEGKGISEELKNKIEIGITIPPYDSRNHPDSLNVAIATAVILSHRNARLIKDSN